MGKCYFPQRKSGHCFQNKGGWPLESKNMLPTVMELAFKNSFHRFPVWGIADLAFIHSKSVSLEHPLTGPGFPTWSHMTPAYSFLNGTINTSGSLNSSSHNMVWVSFPLWFSLKPASDCVFSHFQHCARGIHGNTSDVLCSGQSRAEQSRRAQNHKTLKTKWSFVPPSVWCWL